MIKQSPYTTQLQAGLGMIDETKALLELWEPGMSSPKLQKTALESGRFPTIAARRLHNLISECFSPRYLVNNGSPARCLKLLAPNLSNAELQQLLLIHTCRANLILGDFIREVYWERYAAGSKEISNVQAREFVEKAIDRGLTSKQWSEATIRRVSAYLTGACADFGLLEHNQLSSRRLLPYRIMPKTSACLAYDLHFNGSGDNAILGHADWGLFGMDRYEVLDELKRLALKGLLIVQSAGDAVKIGWKFQDMESACHVISRI